VTSEISSRLQEAEKLVEAECVKKYIIDNHNERWVVVGNSRDYLIITEPQWCRCYDFQRNLMSDDIVHQCKHNLAVKIAQSKGKYDIYHLTKPEYDFIRDYFLF